MKNIIIVVLTLGLLAGMTWLNENPSNKPAPVAQLTIPNNVDYYLKNTRQKSYKKDGSIDFSLNSDLLEHFKREDQSSLLNPDVVVHRSHTWRITAQNGDFYHPTEIIRFSQNVQLDKQSNNSPFHVSAESLLFNIKQDLVISESNVKVKSDSWSLNAKKMILDMNNDIHQFNHVSARYRHDKNS